MKRLFYARQVKGFGIGNFINCTPAIKAASDLFGYKIPTTFYSVQVQSMFKDCPFIEHVDSPPNGGEVLVSSDHINQKITDWTYNYNNVMDKLGISRSIIPHTYVDMVTPPKREREYVVVFRGMISLAWRGRKDPGDEAYRRIIETIGGDYDIVYPASEVDYQRFISNMENWVPSESVVGSTRNTLSYINGAKFVVSNDTGMYHASAALKKPTFVLWKDTNFEKNRAPGNTCTYSFTNNWIEDFSRWYREKEYERC